MKILYVTTISLTINTFFKPHIEALIRNGHHVDIACNYADLALDPFYSSLGSNFFQIDFSRFPLSVNNIRAYKQLKRLISIGDYDIVHCHTPNASIITRLVCKKFRKKTKLKVYYTAHGFHFYKGAPIQNWLLFYPIEKICSYFTDKLITINQEDYQLAKNKFKAKQVHYVPGVGINLTQFDNIQVNKNTTRQSIGVPENAFLLLSVGELNKNKNHQVIIRAIAQLQNPHIHYAIAGIGNQKDYLIQLAIDLNVRKQVHFLGYRKDMPSLAKISDVFCFPSRREGLGLAAIEALAYGLPVLAAKNRGTAEFIIQNQNGYLHQPLDAYGFAESINALLFQPKYRNYLSKNAPDSIKKFNIENVLSIMMEIYDQA